MPVGSQAPSRDALNDNLLRALIDNVQDIITVLLPDGTIVFHNPAIQTVMGYAPDQLVGRNVFAYIHPDDHSTVRDAITATLTRDNGTASAAHRFRHADGTWRHCELIGKAIRGDDGRVNIVTTTRDLTERHTMENRNHLLLSALNSAANSIVITDADGCIVWVSAAFTQLTGYSFDEAVGNNLRMLKSDAHDDAFYKHMWDTITSGNIWFDEVINKRKDGSLYTEEMSITPVRDDDGAIRHFVAIKQDITPRVETERQMRLLSSIVEQTTEGIAVTDLDGKFVFVNEAFAEMHGYGMEQMHGRHISLLYDPEQVPLATAAIRQVFETGAYSGEIERVRADGSRFMGILHASPMLNDRNQPIGIIGAVRDLTDRKAAEKLEQERQSLQDAVQSMNQVLGVLGHELRTPLAALRASSELLISDVLPDLDPDSGLLIRMLHDETVRMADMVDNILEAARLNSGRAKWHWSTVDLDDACRAAFDVVTPLVDTSRVALHRAIEPPGLTMQGDADAIRRLLINLLTNAAKHTGDGSIEVTIRQAVAQGKRQIVIACRDTGEGIEPEIADKLGEPFALNAGLIGGQHINGSGLGLAICTGIASAHGGTMTVRSKVGRGTTFRVTLEADLDQPQAFDEPIDIAQEAA